ncbi:hypothetical protein LEM8419_01636 [Neolewinella maritima]|uniref:Outer membrane protein beta-barrel domain-containing protein n=1 Tax=Neolewinella maritima TaxID=1383882 RepID=A0ABN8F197_9BACT|nr:hypothetical protein [Neolewinella maritima]CAH1000483.1 hypothetical protein LEM8419_01636 [Neolewinella maritima]
MRILLLVATLIVPYAICAQSYDVALGLRVGTEWGATAQLRLPQIDKNFVLEAIVLSSLSKDEGSLTLLGKQHQPLLSRRLNLFYGAGLHAGWNNEINTETGQTFNGPKGLTGVVGLEATVGKVNLSYDFKPALNVTGGESILYTHTAVSVRYVIAKRNSVWSKDMERTIRKRRKDRRRTQRREERAARDKRWYEVWRRD